ncbi:hypothetical protein [Acinetobacter sp. WCHAc010052]|uniref:hypothetical protein n=1 Tax=Acinetobacter sp. WCHAc010052 TaxID=2004647 RepID=UPI000B3CE4E1|nr:hypothetical protein [Acinetobacter sp. WCHAc010052]AXY59241.1 hypothetical protein CDG61_03810 [Acinetobacter sp. WCHAc010052]
MSDAAQSEKIANEKKGWKGLLIGFILSAFFLGFFYLAVSNEPDYMPSQKNKQTDSSQQPAATHAHEDMKMSDAEMKNMQRGEAHTEHAH